MNTITGVLRIRHTYEVPGLGLHTFHAVDDQNHAVHRSQGPVGVLCEIAVAGVSKD